MLMYNKKKKKKAKSKRVSILKGINKFAVGFTIIETMLFLAIAGLIFAGIVASTNGAIRQQRYKDAVQSFADDLRDLYSLAENTQVLDYGGGTARCGTESTTESGRGRSNCSVYGIFATISSLTDGEKNMEARWVVGIDQALINETSGDAAFMEKAKVSTEFIVEGGGSTLKPPITAKSRDILWGADVGLACDTITNSITKSNLCDVGKKLSKNNFVVFLFVYRSPITGSVSTLTGTFEKNKHAIDKEGRWIWENIETLSHSDVSLCVTTGAGMGSKNGLRMITIDGKGSNSNAVRLIEADSDENSCN